MLSRHVLCAYTSWDIELRREKILSVTDPVAFRFTLRPQKQHLTADIGGTRRMEFIAPTITSARQRDSAREIFRQTPLGRIGETGAFCFETGALCFLETFHCVSAKNCLDPFESNVPTNGRTDCNPDDERTEPRRLIRDAQEPPRLIREAHHGIGA